MTLTTPRLRQGDCVRLAPGLGEDPAQLDQVIGIDEGHDRCWLRRCPLARPGSAVFEFPLQQVEAPVHHRPQLGPSRS
ncbi:MAG: hypothetical protein VKI83_05825 [Synechococcaceae cyanobacterium]|nr:hypothetical protein [Synechococcaceae cyanobacterium]